MDMLCLDVLHSDWHDYRGTAKDEDRLLSTEWWKQLIARWNFSVEGLPDASTIATFHELRALMQRVVQALLQEHVSTEQDITLLNSYLDRAPSKLELITSRKNFELQQVSLTGGWEYVLGEVAISFATLLAQYDSSRIKQCENPDCRWIYYDESANQTRRWCEDSCANLMRVRRFRTRQQAKE